MPRRLSLALLAVLFPLAVPGAQVISDEYRVKAAYLYNFVRYVEWLEPVKAPLTICVAGQNPFGTVLEDLVRNERVRGIPLRTEVVPGPVDECNVIFTPRTSNVQAYLKAVAGTPTLTVGESKGFIDQGGLINFVLDHGNVRFEINRSGAERAGLRISSRLLQLARLVEPGVEEP
ncbi:MAG TPA: YfiR family protein [Vicinamibacterales bacterium]|jgi:hypothetical protein|nr:YfiR family protein [Vicinamibacterales bacterium]